MNGNPPTDDDLVRAYDLARDREYVERIQKATVKSSAFALSTDHGLFGSARWWDALRDGEFPIFDLEGTVTRVYLSRANWPEFEVEADGERSTWALEGDASRYKVGKRVRIRFVMQRYKEPQPGSESDAAKVVIGIWLEP